MFGDVCQLFPADIWCYRTISAGRNYRNMNVGQSHFSLFAPHGDGEIRYKLLLLFVPAAFSSVQSAEAQNTQKHFSHRRCGSGSASKATRSSVIGVNGKYLCKHLFNVSGAIKQHLQWVTTEEECGRRVKWRVAAPRTGLWPLTSDLWPLTYHCTDIFNLLIIIQKHVNIIFTNTNIIQAANM